MPGHWVIGALANNQWSYAGWGKNNVNALLVQPFINYNFPDGWYVASSPIITANWVAASDNRWTLPIGGGIGKIFKFDHKFPPINLQLQASINVVWFSRNVVFSGLLFSLNVVPKPRMLSVPADYVLSSLQLGKSAKNRHFVGGIAAGVEAPQT